MVWKASIHSGLSYPTSPLIGALHERQRVAGAPRDHRQQPHDEQRVERHVTGAMDERRHAERRQRLHHRLEVGDRPRRLEARPVEQRLVVVQARGLDATAQGEREGPRRSLAETAEMEAIGHPGEHRGHPGVGAEVRQQAVTRPRPNEQAVEHDEPHRLARLQRCAREPVPLGPEARERPDVPLDAGMLAP